MNPTTIEALIQFGLSIFTQVFSLFHHSNVPTSAAPAITDHLTSTPGMTAEHHSVITSAVNTAVTVANAANAGPQPSPNPQ